MSISNPCTTDFDHWISEEFGETGAFTALVVLVQITETQVTPLCSTHFNVTGDELDWSEITALFVGAGAAWDAASFFPVTAPDGGPLHDPTARLRDVEARVEDDRLVLNQGNFFDKWGRRLKIEQVEPQ